MPIDPRTGAAPGDFSGVAAIVNDLDRRVRALIAQNGQLGANSITGVQIGDNTITAANIVAGTITAVLIAANTITAGQIAANTITSAQIAAGSITASSLAADSVTATAIQAGSINAGHIQADAINATHLQANSVGVSELQANSVTATAILAGSVDASKISVTTLSSVATNMGLVTAGIFQTGTSGARVMMGTSINTTEGTKNGIVGVDASNNITFLIEPATGDARFKGVVQPGSSGLGNIDGLTQNATLMAGGNLLNHNDSLTTTDLIPYTTTNSTKARSTTTFWTQPASLQVTPTATSAVQVQTTTNSGGVTTRIPVSASTIYSYAMTMFCSKALTATLNIAWYNSGGGLISISSASSVTTLPGQWQRLEYENVTSPGTAASCIPYLQFTGHAASGDNVYIDNVIFVAFPVAQGAVVITNSITAAEISVGSLSAITANLGTVTAGSISGVTITGGTITGSTIQTSATATTNGVVLNSSGLTAYSSSVAVVTIPATGGTATFTGKLAARGIEIPWGATSPGVLNRVSFMNGATQQSYVQAHELGGIPYIALLSDRGSYSSASVAIDAEINNTGGRGGLKANNGGVYAYYLGATTQLLNSSGQMFTASDIVAGSAIYTADGTSGSNRSIYLRSNGYTPVQLYNNVGIMYSTAAIQSASQISAPAVKTDSGGAFSFGASGAVAYLAEDWGFTHHSGGDARFNFNGARSSGLLAYGAGTGGAGPYNSGTLYYQALQPVSDRWHKENIRDLWNSENAASLRIKGLRVRRFDRSVADDMGVHKDEIGFIAQEVAAVDPDLVDHIGGSVKASTIKAQSYTLKFMAMFALTVAALQEQIDAVEKLTDRVAALEAA